MTRNMNDKKGEMSLQVIVVAVLVLIILVVLVLIFTGKIKMFSSTTGGTADQYSGNKCQVPGTGNQCWDDSAEACRSKGGSYMEVSNGYDDCCSSPPCYTQCCYM